MLRSAGSTLVVLFDDQLKPARQIQMNLTKLEMEICFLPKEMAGHGRESHVLAKVMLQSTYLDLNLGSPLSV